MSVTYTGFTRKLTVVPHTVASVTPGAKATNIVHVQIGNTDREFRRTLSFWLLKHSPTYDILIAEDIGIEYGTTLEFSGITLGAGETLVAYAETNDLLTITMSIGDQR